MTKRTVRVFLPTASRFEADTVRRIFAPWNDCQVRPCVSEHTAGQALYDDDVIVVGDRLIGIGEDVATGQLHRVERLDQLEALIRRLSGTSEAEPPIDSDANGSADEDEPDLSTMPRSLIIKYAAAHWPGQRNWTRFNTDDLLAEIDTLRSGAG